MSFRRFLDKPLWYLISILTLFVRQTSLCPRSSAAGDERMTELVHNWNRQCFMPQRRITSEETNSHYGKVKKCYAAGISINNCNVNNESIIKETIIKEIFIFLYENFSQSRKLSNTKITGKSWISLITATRVVKTWVTLAQSFLIRVIFPMKLESNFHLFCTLKDKFTVADVNWDLHYIYVAAIQS